MHKFVWFNDSGLVYGGDWGFVLLFSVPLYIMDNLNTQTLFKKNNKIIAPCYGCKSGAAPGAGRAEKERRMMRSRPETG